MFSREDILGALIPCPYFSGFDDFTFEFNIWSSERAIFELHTCRENRVTFIEQADNVLNKMLDDFGKRALCLADNFDNQRPLFIPVFIHHDLKTRWPNEYPANSKIPDNAFIVEDGNARLTALAIRYRRRETILKRVGVFLGHIPNSMP